MHFFIIFNLGVRVLICVFFNTFDFVKLYIVQRTCSCMMYMFSVLNMSYYALI